MGNILILIDLQWWKSKDGRLIGLISASLGHAEAEAFDSYLGNS
jgi:hypothetical protein